VKNTPKNDVALEQDLAEKGGGITVNNPVLITDREAGSVHFLYCVEYRRCYYRRSDDDGRTFSDPVDITSALEKFRPDYDWKVIATGPVLWRLLSKLGLSAEYDRTDPRLQAVIRTGRMAV